METEDQIVVNALKKHFISDIAKFCILPYVGNRIRWIPNTRFRPFQYLTREARSVVDRKNARINADLHFEDLKKDTEKYMAVFAKKMRKRYKL